MDLRIEKSELEAGINTVIKAVSTSATGLPVLKGILIDAEDGTIRLTGNNLEMAVTTVVSGMVLVKGKTVIDGKLLAEVVKKLPNGQASLEVNEVTALLRCEKAKFKLPVMASDEYPVTPMLDGETKEVVLEKSAFKEMAAGSLFSLGTNDTNKMLTGGCFEAEGDMATLTCLDGHRIAIVKRKASGCSGKIKVIIPGKALSEVARVMKGAGDLKIFCTENHCKFCFDETEFQTRLISGEYYRIDKMINFDSSTEITLGKDTMSETVDRGITITSSMKKPLVFHIADGSMKVTAVSALGELDEELAIEKTGSDLQIGFNPHFLMDALKVIPDEKVRISFNSGKSPCKLSDVGETYMYLVLPVNIG